MKRIAAVFCLVLLCALAADCQTNTFCASNNPCTITGIWNFSTSPTAPDPTTSFQVANKEYVDGKIGTTAWAALTSGTNTTGTFFLGTGNSLSVSGSGVNNANEINGVALSGLATGSCSIRRRPALLQS